MHVKITIALMCFGMAGAAHADSCHTPRTIYENTGNPGDTCLSHDWLPSFGPIPRPQRDVVYHFQAWDDNVTLTLNLEGFPEAVMFLLPSPCAATTVPLDMGSTWSPLVMPPGTLINGQDYFVVVTAVPESPPGTCGYYSLSADIQYHDVIFANGFE